MTNEQDSSKTPEETTSSETTEHDHNQLPVPSFSTFVFSIASSALVQLGEMPNPETGKPEKNLLMAKHTIDMLSMLQDKTQGNLDESEKQLMDGVLYELRMKYITCK